MRRHTQYTYFKSQFGPGFCQQLFVSSGAISQWPPIHAHDVDDQEFADAEFRFGAADARNVRADAREFVSDDGGAQRRVQASTYRIGVAAGIRATRVGSRFEEGLHAGKEGGAVKLGWRRTYLGSKRQLLNSQKELSIKSKTRKKTWRKEERKTKWKTKHQEKTKWIWIQSDKTNI